jgi:hypothetical protein
LAPAHKRLQYQAGKHGDLSRLHHSPQIFNAEMAVSEDLVQQSGPQRFARVYRNDGIPAIFVAKKVMATPDASNLKAALRQGGDQFSR